jgi:glyoxylase-like metal-dependent hydrolase (beta-lactamase superfamily II)
MGKGVKAGSVEKVSGDKDVFEDGSVVMLATPGHTMGHYSLLVRLPQSGPVILSGDLWHFSEQVSHNGVPLENVDRAATLASMDRILKSAANLKAKIIIQHEATDIPKLPLFPASAQ